MSDPLDRLPKMIAVAESTRCTCEIDTSPLPHCALCEARDRAYSDLAALAPELARCAMALRDIRDRLDKPNGAHSSYAAGGYDTPCAACGLRALRAAMAKQGDST